MTESVNDRKHTSIIYQLPEHLGGNLLWRKVLASILAGDLDIAARVFNDPVWDLGRFSLDL